MSEEEIFTNLIRIHIRPLLIFYPLLHGWLSERPARWRSQCSDWLTEQERCSGIKLRPALFGRQFKHNENRQQRRLERWSYLFCPFGISPTLYRKKRFCFGHIINPHWSRLFSQDGWKSWMSASFFFAPVFMDLDDKKVKKKKKIGQLPSSLTEQTWPKLNTCIVYQPN